MPVIFMEGFDLYPDLPTSQGGGQSMAPFTGKWSSGQSGSSGGWYNLGTEYGRFGSKGIALTGSSLGRSVNHSNRTFVGLACRVTQLNDADRPIMIFDGLSGYNVTLTIKASGTLQLTSSDVSFNNLVSTAGIVLANVWNYYECLIDTSNTTAQVLIRMNGVDVINSGVVGSTSGTWNYFTIATRGGLLSGTASTWYDDMYMLDATGVDAGATFLGDVRVQVLRPNADGDSIEMDRTGGTSAGNYTAVNEVNPDGDTSYVSSNVLNEKDLYQLENLTDLTTDVVALSVSMLIRKDEAGNRKVAALVKTNDVGNTITPSADIVLTAGYVNTQSFYQVNPVTGVAWTPAQINALQAGVKITV